ncbi:PEP-CTERM sorting domain-containing protein [Massilia pinisoli]|uniref:PEP-CTERM sorting domain-containing protein n=1 Tax=Massilia pinisoli TaxID=1772194 RepID=A0ABT2A063_9BURK|nr:PEP-CTERM sorting domain-containing protein [Massilia pinisoli]MCS0585229.1 PEP-CTERM sorting domain-containing protein [Massilia pinisoli]
MKYPFSYAAAAVLLVLSCSAQASPITSPGDPALTGATVQNFDSVAAGDYLSLSLPGVTINGNGSPVTICNGCGGGSGAFGDVGNSLQNTFGSPASFDLVFTAPVSAFGIQGGAFNGVWTYTAYDSLDNVIETLNVNHPCCGPFFDGIAHDGIARVNLNGSGDWVVFENLQFVAGSITDVPEPATLALFGLGFAGLVRSARRKQTS